MKNFKFIIFVLLALTVTSFGQKKAKEEAERMKNEPPVVLGITDRAGGVHNASNIGLFFENRGKLYPRRLSQGPSGEFPLNSGKHYIYRVNPIVGIPGNVIQGRFTTNEEWEAQFGFHNSNGARIAFSDNPNTWPASGWPIKDADGNPVIKSNQDSYAVYSDSNNSISVLGISIAQTGYAYGVKFLQNLLFFKYEIINTSNKDHNDLYFALYADIDVGNVSGGVPEYADDRLGWDKDKNFLYFYDDGISNEWPDGKTGLFGLTFLKTPLINGVEAGITDMHYCLYDDDDISDVDSVWYGRIASSPSLYNSSLGPKFFHLGNNTSLRYDDVTTIPASGLDILATVSSGPYTLKAGDTLTFYTAFVAGDNLTELYSYLNEAYNMLQYDFEFAKPPVTPKLSGVSADTENLLYWDDAAERSIDAFSNQYDFEGYRVYRSIDRGVKWDLLADFDLVNENGIDRGIQYSYRDTNVVNGFEYWYTVTAYDRGDSLIESLESPLGKTLESENLVALIPYSSALGRTPVSVKEPVQTGNGLSNYNFNFEVKDDNGLASNNYEIGFKFEHRTLRGKSVTYTEAVISDSTLTKPERYGLYFKAPNLFDFVNLTTGENIRENNSYVATNPNQFYTIPGAGMRMRVVSPPGTPADLLPKAGDLLTLNFSVYGIRNGIDTVIKPRPFFFDKPQATSDGVIFSMSKPNPVKSVSRIGGTDKFDLTFASINEAQIKNLLYIISVTGKGSNSNGENFISINVKTSTDSLVANFDTVYAVTNIEFGGVRGRVDYNSNNPPNTGNAYSLQTIKPVAPNVRDKFAFGIEGSKINNSVVTSELNRVRVVPNPYVVSSLYEPEFGELRREPLRQIQFINLPSECTIHIFTVDADLVKTIYHSATNGTAIWDLRTEGGREIASGMYMYVVKTADSQYIDRFAVLK